MTESFDTLIQKIRESPGIEVEDCEITRKQDGLGMRITSNSHSELPGTVSLYTFDEDLHIAVKSVEIKDKYGRLVSSPKLYKKFHIGLSKPKSGSSLCHSLMDDGTIQSQENFDLDNVAKGQKYSLSTYLDKGGTLTVEALPVDEGGKTCINAHHNDVTAGDFVFNIILQWPNDDRRNKKGYFTDVKMQFKTDKKFVRKRDMEGRTFYNVQGTCINLYMPNQYYVHDTDSGGMKIESMEQGYPYLSTTEGPAIFTFRFRKSSRIFYKPCSLVMRLQNSIDDECAPPVNHPVRIPPLVLLRAQLFKYSLFLVAVIVVIMLWMFWLH